MVEELWNWVRMSVCASAYVCMCACVLSSYSEGARRAWENLAEAMPHH